MIFTEKRLTTKFGPEKGFFSRGSEVLTESAPYIHIKQLYKSFAGPAQKVEVLKGLDLEINRGESVAIMGASGVGKSTLLHILGTLDRPSAGEIWVDGQNLFSLDEPTLAAFRNQHIGFVFQFHHLLAEFTALENVMMPALIARVETAQARKQANDLLEEVGLGQRVKHRVGELSGGEQQRVAVARALVMNPSLLLADEPTGNLDESTGEHVHELLVRLNEQRGLTTLVATHNQNLARAMGRRMGLAGGRAQIL